MWRGIEMAIYECGGGLPRKSSLAKLRMERLGRSAREVVTANLVGLGGGGRPRRRGLRVVGHAATAAHLGARNSAACGWR